MLIHDKGTRIAILESRCIMCIRNAQHNNSVILILLVVHTFPTMISRQGGFHGTRNVPCTVQRQWHDKILQIIPTYMPFHRAQPFSNEGFKVLASDVRWYVVKLWCREHSFFVSLPANLQKFKHLLLILRCYCMLIAMANSNLTWVQSGDLHMQ